MIKARFNDFQQQFVNGQISLTNKSLDRIFQTFNFIFIEKKITLNDNIPFYQNLLSSKVIIINKIELADIPREDKYFLITFEKTVLLINQSRLDFLEDLVFNIPKLSICFLSGTNKIFSQLVDFEYNTIVNDYLDTEILKFNQSFKTQQKIHPLLWYIWDVIKSSISGYLIEKSYLKNVKNRISDYFSRPEKVTIKENISDYEYIKLRMISQGSTFIVHLIYYIENEELFVLKIPNQKTVETSNLIQREFNNYLKMNYPFFPSLFGTTKDNKYLIIEFINGQTLLEIKEFEFNDEEKITIIFQLMLILEFLYKNKYVYRDLKPNNIMIDDSRNVVLIDFDRMIDFDTDRKRIDHTKDFSEVYSAPELNQEILSSSNDIFSLGRMIDYIINEKMPDKFNNIEGFEKFPELKQICIKCINHDYQSRPSIKQLIEEYFKQYKTLIKIDMNHLNKLFKINESKISSSDEIDLNDPSSLFILGLIHLKKEHFDINQSIHFLTLASEKNYPEAQYFLGKMYAENTLVRRNANKTIHYLTLAANQNYADAQRELAIIYYEGDIVSQDLNKAIYYFSLAANQNDLQAQNNLGIIYIDKKIDINNGFNYLKRAADQNYAPAQFNLGRFYYYGIFITKDINKAIYYLELAANQNTPEAQHLLGTIFYDGKYVKQDINKSLTYFSLAANQNIAQSQFCLGSIYYEGIYVHKNISKSIQYFTLASKQNFPNATYNLSVIYFELKDIAKSISYLQQAANLNLPIAQYNFGKMLYEGIIIPQDINRAIFNLTLAAKNNYIDAQFLLGMIYYVSPYIPKDITRSIYYLTLAANQNNPEAQYNLSLIYYEGKVIQRDISKAIYYASLASNQYYADSSFLLGTFFFSSKYVKHDLNKAIHYFQLAANKNHKAALFNLGVIYSKTEYSNQKKAIHYFTLAAKQKHPKAQYIISLYCLEGVFFQRNVNVAIDLLKSSFSNGFVLSGFALGFLYHEGKHIKRDIELSIKYYKDASSMNNNFAKNNLAIIFKNGYEDKIKKNIKYAKELLQEAIHHNADILAMYHLAKIYIYEEPNEKNIDKSINLLIRSSKDDFFPSKELLCIILIHRYGTNIENIRKALNDKNLFEKLNKIMKDEFLLENKSILDQRFDFYRNFEILYNQYLKFVSYEQLMNTKNNSLSQQCTKNISKEFYEGLGDII